MVPDLEEPGEPRAAEDRAIGLERVRDAPRRQEHDDTADEEREQHGQQRGDESARLLEEPVALGEVLRLRPARFLRQLVNLGQAACSLPPPVIASPSSASVTVGGNSADDLALVHDEDSVGQREDLVELE